jgi:hypothetical protein
MTAIPVSLGARNIRKMVYDTHCVWPIRDVVMVAVMQGLRAQPTGQQY